MIAASLQSRAGRLTWLRAARKLGGVVRALARQGPTGAAHLLWLYLGARGLVALEIVWARSLLTLQRRIEPYVAARRIARLRRRTAALVTPEGEGFRVRTDDLELAPETRRALDEARRSSDEVELGWIDQDGFFVPVLGPVGGLPQLPGGEPLRRRRSDVALVDLSGVAAIRKDYRGDRISFANEVEALAALNAAQLRVPALLAVDCDRLVLHTSFIPGPIVREALAHRGARLRDRDVLSDPAFAGLSPEEARRRRIDEGRRELHRVMTAAQVCALTELVRAIHRLGFVCLDVKYGNVVLEQASRRPYWIDFGDLRRARAVGRWGQAALRDADLEEVNVHFGTQLLTRERLKRRLREIPKEHVYAPVHFGADLKLGAIWDDGAGYGRWLRLLGRHMPPLQGRRVLDIGANNAANAIEMLRRGAREVVAIELDARNIEQGKLVRDGVEWADNRRYALQHLQADMRSLPEMPLGRFDIVTALCCLYYLEEAEMVRLVRHLRSITNLLVLQCNVARNIGRQDADVYRRASVEFTLDLLREAGFEQSRVIAPPRYTRPLVISATRVNLAHAAVDDIAVSALDARAPRTRSART